MSTASDEDTADRLFARELLGRPDNDEAGGDEAGGGAAVTRSCPSAGWVRWGGLALVNVHGANRRETG